MTTTFVSKLIVAPQFGDLIVIRGKTQHNLDVFAINLASDKNAQNAPLHLSFRMKENLFVRNNKINGNFISTSEERGLLNNQRFALKSGDEFLLHILVGVERFHISINKVHYCDFQFRQPINLIRYIAIDRDIESIYQVDHRKVFPFVFPALQLNKSWYSFSSDIPTPFRPGNLVVIKGYTTGNRQGSFNLRFMVSHTEKTAMLFNARFAQSTVVRNHSINDKIEYNTREEERQGGFPFTFGGPFKIVFGLTDRVFRIAVNGKHFTDYNMRVPLDTLTGIKSTDSDGLVLRIYECEYHAIDANLTGYETYSRL